MAHCLTHQGNEDEIQTAVESLSTFLFSSDNQWERSTAIEALTGIGDQRAIEPLVKALNLRDGILAGLAAKGLAELNAQDAIPDLIEAFGHSFYMKKQTALALGDLKASEATEVLLQHSEIKSPLEEVWVVHEANIAAMTALGLIGHPDAEDMLGQELNWLTKEDEAQNSEMKFKHIIKLYDSIAWGCYRIGSPKTIALLRRIALNPNDLVNEWAGRLLKQLGISRRPSWKENGYRFIRRIIGER